MPPFPQPRRGYPLFRQPPPSPSRLRTLPLPRLTGREHPPSPNPAKAALPPPPSRPQLPPSPNPNHADGGGSHRGRRGRPQMAPFPQPHRVGGGGTPVACQMGRGRPEMATNGRHGQSAAPSIISQRLDLGRPLNQTAQIKVWGRKFFPAPCLGKLYLIYIYVIEVGDCQILNIYTYTHL